MKKLDNKGLSLVEMIISVGIFAVIMVSVFSVLTIATKLSNNNNFEVNAQNEAQALINQLDNILSDAAKVEPQAAGANIDEFGTYDATAKKWNTVPYYLILSDKKVYFTPKNVAGAAMYSDDYLLAEDIEDFKIDNTNLKKYGYVTVSFTVKKGTAKFAASKNVFIRNYKTDRK